MYNYQDVNPLVEVALKQLLAEHMEEQKEKKKKKLEDAYNQDGLSKLSSQIMSIYHFLVGLPLLKMMDVVEIPSVKFKKIMIYIRKG